MLLNSQGQKVVLPINAKEYQLIPLREVIVPLPYPTMKNGLPSMFSLGERARIKGN